MAPYNNESACRPKHMSQERQGPMKSSILVLTPTAILFSGLLAFAGVELAMGRAPSDLSLAAVKPYTAKFDYFVDGDAGELEKAGSWTDIVSVDQGMLSRTVRRFTNEGVVDLVRTVIVDRETIEPVRIQQRFGPELANVYQLEYSDQTLTQILIGDASTPARVSSVEMSEPVMETGLQGVFVLSLPQEKSGEIQVNTYVAGADPKATAKTFHIMGQEQVEVLGQTLEAWRIEDRASQWTYWVRRNKPYIVKVVHPVPGGKMATSLVTGFD